MPPSGRPDPKQSRRTAAPAVVGARAARGRIPHRFMLAILLLVPLVHGAGAHLTQPDEAGVSLSAPVDDLDFDAVDELCSFCAAARGTRHLGSEANTELPRIASTRDRVRGEGRVRSSRDRARPGSPRAPPTTRA